MFCFTLYLEINLTTNPTFCFYNLVALGQITQINNNLKSILFRRLQVHTCWTRFLHQFMLHRHIKDGTPKALSVVKKPTQPPGQGVKSGFYMYCPYYALSPSFRRSLLNERPELFNLYRPNKGVKTMQERVILRNHHYLFIQLMER